MRNNNLVGKLPDSLSNLSSLTILQLSQNKLTGHIPSWFGSHLRELEILELRSNRFSGDVSNDLCRHVSLHVLDLAHNNLSGDIPKCFKNFSGMSHENNVGYKYFESAYATATIVMRGREDKYYDSTIGLVTMLDLSGNHFSGSIPNELTSLKGLVSLSLSGNHLTGRIPYMIGDMKNIEYIDLSHNQLEGEIPVSLSDLNFLHALNLSYNNLTGRIPTSTQIQGLDNSSFIGNRLCGPPLSKGCGVETHDDDGQDMKHKRGNTSHETDWGFIISILLGFAIGFWIVLGPLILSVSWRIRYFQILYSVWYQIYDIICQVYFQM